MEVLIRGVKQLATMKEHTGFHPKHGGLIINQLAFIDVVCF